jgi:outer membrane cobalamin receptor
MKRTSVVVAVVVMMSGIASMVSAEEKNVKLNEVVVTATKTEKELKDVTQSVTVITGDEIRKSGATTVAEAVRDAVGVNINDNGTRGSLQTISIRGASYAQVLVLLDGKRMNSSRDGGVDLSALPVAIDDIERIEIVRGSSSALYGADAVGGVVNIITKKPTQNVSKIGGAIGSHGYDNILASMSGKEGGLTYTITGDRETSNGYRLNSDLDQKIVNGRIGYGLSSGSSLDLTTNYISKEIGVPGMVQFPSPHARQLERETVLGLSYQQKVGKEWIVKLSGNQNQNALEYQDPDFFINSRHETTSKIGEAQVSGLINSWNLLTIGYETRRSDLNSTDAGIHSASNVAGYLQDEISLGDSLIFVVGDRLDKHSIYGDKASPRASARYLINKTGTIVRVSAGKSFRAPTFNDLYWPNSIYTYPTGTTTSINYITQGNTGLVPETAREYEGSIEQSLGKDSLLKVTGFHRKVNNLINWTTTVTTLPTSTDYTTAPQNIGSVDIKGWETEVAFRISDSVIIGANYTYTNPIDEFTGQKIYYTIPKSQTKGHVNISLDTDTYLYVEGRSVENYVEPGKPIWHYTVVDAKIAEKIGKKTGAKGEIFFAMTNIFDRKFDSIRSSSGDYPGPPKEIRGGITVPF